MRASKEAETAKLPKGLEGSRFEAPVFSALTSGWRRGETSALRWRDFDLKRGEAALCQSN